jgi:hypothetical protein
MIWLPGCVPRQAGLPSGHGRVELMLGSTNGLRPMCLLLGMQGGVALLCPLSGGINSKTTAKKN